MSEFTLEQVSAMMHAASLAKSRLEELEATAKADHERIDYMLEDATAVDRRLIADTVANVEQFWLGRLEEMDPNDRKSIKLAWGNISARVQQPEYVRDKLELTKWALEHGYERTLPPQVEADWERMKQDADVVDEQMLINGEAVAGVRVVERGPKVQVSID